MVCPVHHYFVKNVFQYRPFPHPTLAVEICKLKLVIRQGRLKLFEVYFASIICVSFAGHIFVQQPTHPTFPALERLDSCMYNTYSQFSAPELSRPILPNSICVAPSNGGWYRCQVGITNSCHINRDIFLFRRANM